MNLESNRDNVYGSALGPDWSFDLAIKGAAKVLFSFLHRIFIKY